MRAARAGRLFLIAYVNDCKKIRFLNGLTMVHRRMRLYEVQLHTNYYFVINLGDTEALKILGTRDGTCHFIWL